MSDTKHVLFVCTGNTCRSPMAEGLMRKALADRKDITTASAGVSAFPGSAASADTLEALKKRGASLEDFQSQPVSEQLLEQASHVFAMTEGHLAILMSHFPEHEDKYYLLREFSGIKDKREGSDVPDPIGMGSAAYEEVAKVFEAAIPKIIAYVDAGE
ncbi:MAG: low molecular weight protein arginine phosphatase [Akkermansiaceae bacterium]|nr:low molecular weight protein arginine phosphatase [Akkermansiaceae bacterium]